jgi:polysaccharide export outer membrane protein
MRLERLASIVALLLSMAVGLAAQSPDYRAGAGDVLTVTVWNQASLSGRFTVEADGTFAYPLLGRVMAAGLTVREIEAALTAQLAAGFVKDPQVRATIEQHRSQRVLVLGEVRTPGSYPLTRATTLVEVLAIAGSTTARAGSEAIVIRGSPDAPAQLPASGQPLPPDISRIRLDELEGLNQGRTFLLLNGDLVFVPPAPTVHVFGEVRSPGEYPLRKPSTVLQILAVAGGLTDRASKKDIRVVRTVDGKTVEQTVRLESDVAAGDIIIVRARLF